MPDSPEWLLVPFQILLVDLLLGADNALVIALACRSLPPADMRKAAIIGVAGAILLRLLLTMVATSLLALPLVKLIGAFVLVGIALNIVDGDDLGEEATRPRAASQFWTAAAVIVVADASMSIDNVIALAAIARGSFGLLAIGVALSLPILVYGGLIMTRLLRWAPGLIPFGAALLGWIAGDMAVGDPLIAEWANAQAPGLVAIAPALGAAFVFFQARPARLAPARALRPTPRVAEPTPRFAPRRAPSPETSQRPANRDDRVAIIGVLVLAVVAGAIIMIASYFDSFN